MIHMSPCHESTWALHKCWLWAELPRQHILVARGGLRVQQEGRCEKSVPG